MGIAAAGLPALKLLPYRFAKLAASIQASGGLKYGLFELLNAGDRRCVEQLYVVFSSLWCEGCAWCNS